MPTDRELSVPDMIRDLCGWGCLPKEVTVMHDSSGAAIYEWHPEEERWGPKSLAHEAVPSEFGCLELIAVGAAVQWMNENGFSVEFQTTGAVVLRPDEPGDDPDELVFHGSSNLSGAHAAIKAVVEGGGG